MAYETNVYFALTLHVDFWLAVALIYESFFVPGSRVTEEVVAFLDWVLLGQRDRQDGRTT